MVGSQLVAGNWLSAAQRSSYLLVDALGVADNHLTVVEPNLAMVHCGTDVFAAVSHSAGHTRSTVVWALMRLPGGTAEIDARWLAEVVQDRM